MSSKRPRNVNSKPLVLAHHPPVSETPTEHVIVGGLQRPYPVPGLRKYLSELANISLDDDNIFWINDLRTICLMTLPSVEQSKAFAASVNGKVYPVSSTSTLTSSYSSLSVVEHIERVKISEAALAAAETPSREEMNADDSAQIKEEEECRNPAQPVESEERQNTTDGDKKEDASSLRDRKLRKLKELADEKCKKNGLAMASESTRVITGKGARTSSF